MLIVTGRGRLLPELYLVSYSLFETWDAFSKYSVYNYTQTVVNLVRTKSIVALTSIS